MYLNVDDYFTDVEIQDNDTITELNREIDDSIPTPLLKKWMEDVISKVLRIVCLFRRSPVKNSILQKYVNEEKGRELSLLLDFKTCWNSIIAMIERFILLKKPVFKALIDISSTKRIDSIDLEILENICTCLKPLEMAVCVLSRCDATLLSAEGILIFLMDQFKIFPQFHFLMS